MTVLVLHARRPILLVRVRDLETQQEAYVGLCTRCNGDATLVELTRWGPYTHGLFEEYTGLLCPRCRILYAAPHNELAILADHAGSCPVVTQVN